MEVCSYTFSGKMQYKYAIYEITCTRTRLMRCASAVICLLMLFHYSSVVISLSICSKMLFVCVENVVKCQWTEYFCNISLCVFLVAWNLSENVQVSCWIVEFFSTVTFMTHRVHRFPITVYTAIQGARVRSLPWSWHSTAVS